MAQSNTDRTDHLLQVCREFADSIRRGEQPSLADWQLRHPELANDLDRVFQDTVHVRANSPGAKADIRSQPSNLDNVVRQVGDYDIVREIGRGGMGVVYEAEQRSLGRRVALKILPFQLAQDQQSLERFRREARSAAQLHHTNIVPVFEVGQDGDVCYYVMQYIEGCSLAQDVIRLGQNPLPFPEHQRRVAQLGEHVAHALAYAHERGIVHRDIKPSNLLLDGSGTVWITDFGLAKAAGDDITMTGDLVGSLCFMAPERFRGQGDHRVDIYALGLTLYELLLLRPGYASVDHVQLMEQVQRSEPPPPRTVEARVSRDLETIILKAIDKDPARRYQTAAAMAEDLRRLLADEPIQARPVGAVEKAIRAARRNPRLASLLAVVGMLVVTLIAGATVAALSFRHLAGQERQQAELAREAERDAKTAQDKAEDETKAAHEISTFLLGLLEEADPLTLSGRGFGTRKLGDQHLTPLEMLNLAADRLKTTLRDRPAVRAALLDKVGSVYVSFGQFARAKPLLEEALAMRQQLYGDEHLELAESWHHIGYFQQAQLYRADAVAAYQKALDIRSKLLGEDDPLVAETLIHLGFLKSQFPGTTDGEAMLRRAQKIQAKHFGENSREYGVALVALYQYHFQRGENVKLLMLSQETDTLVKGIGKQNKLAVAIHTFIQGQTEKRLSKFSKAAEKYEEALTLGEPLIGKTHFFVLIARKELGFLYLDNLKRPDQAAKQFSIAHERLTLMNEEQSSEGGFILLHWGRALRDQQKYAEAEPILRQAAAILRKEKGDLGRTLHCLAEVLAKDDRWRDAEPVLAEAVEVRKARSDADKWWYGRVLDFYVAALIRHGKSDQAITTLREHIPELDLHVQPNADYHFRHAARRGRLCVLLADQPAETRQADLVKAMTSLRQAVQAGFRDTAALKTDPDLAPLRALPEFAKLLEKK